MFLSDPPLGCPTKITVRGTCHGYTIPWDTRVGPGGIPLKRYGTGFNFRPLGLPQPGKSLISYILLHYGIFF